MTMFSKNKIRWLISLMSAATLMLVAFQGYWINNAYQLRTEGFNLKATDAIQDVVRKLEKQEVVYLMRQRQELENQEYQLELLRKTPVVRHSKPAPSKVTEQLANVPSKENEDWVRSHFGRSDVYLPQIRQSFDGQNLSIQITSPPVLSLTEPLNDGEIDLSEISEPTELNTVDVTKRPYEIAPINSQYIKKEAEIKQKIKLLKDVAKELIYSQRPISQRVNTNVIDELLRKSLTERGLDTTFEFSIKSAQDNSVFTTVGFNSDVSPKQLFQTTLFPNEINSHANVLSVYFPNRQQYIFSNLAATLVASVLLLGFMLGCFYVATSTIIKQKKLADIKNDFINNMTHEFKTPISTIALASDMAQDNLQNSEKLQRYLGIIKSENQRLGGHVERVLHIAQTDREGLNLKKTEVNIHHIIEQTLNSLEVRLEQKNTELDLQFDATNETLMADEVHLTNVLYNLIDNALKYSQENLVLKISTQNLGNQIVIKISDNGIGISEEAQKRIFEPFYRVSTGNVHDVKGFGLGLNYVKKIVEAHRGRIEVKSELGGGTEFVLIF